MKFHSLLLWQLNATPSGPIKTLAPRETGQRRCSERGVSLGGLRRKANAHHHKLLVSLFGLLPKIPPSTPPPPPPQYTHTHILHTAGRLLVSDAGIQKPQSPRPSAEDPTIIVLGGACIANSCSSGKWKRQQHLQLLAGCYYVRADKITPTTDSTCKRCTLGTQGPKL